MTTEPDETTHPLDTDHRRAPWPAVVLELLGSVVAAFVLVSLPLHFLSTRVTFFGDQAVVHADDVRTYWTLVAALTVGVVASFAGALWRGGRKAFWWHTPVAILGLAAALAFAVTQAGPVV
jgi:hypothetical protein